MPIASGAGASPSGTVTITDDEAVAVLDVCRRVMMRLAVLPVAPVLLSACGSSTSTGTDYAAEGKYLGDLEARGVPTGVTNGAPPALGHAICKDLDDGKNAPLVMFQIANPQLDGKDQFTTTQGEEIVYWAVKDPCPKHSGEDVAVDGPRCHIPPNECLGCAL
jgi:hypothetical protein